MAMGSGPRGTMLSEINVTPLVDVMLVLLIIFMITAPLTQEGVEVSVPTASDAKPIGKKEGMTRVSITKGGAVYFNENRVAQLNPHLALSKGRNVTELENVTAIARRTPAMQNDKEVYIEAHHSLSYGVVMNVMVKLQKAGVAKLGLVTRPPDVE